MPDWSYRTFSRPILFRLPHDRARRLAVSLLGRISSLPQGWRVVDALGHMAPDRALERRVEGVSFPSPFGLSPVIDAEGRAVDAFSRFGFGLIVVGPVGLEEPARPIRCSRTQPARGVRVDGTHAIGLSRARALSIRTPGRVKLVFEIAYSTDLEDAGDTTGGTGGRLIDGLAESADMLILSARSFARLAELEVEQARRLLERLASRARERKVPLVLGVPVTASVEGVRVLVSGLDLGVSISGRPGDAGAETTWVYGEGDHVPAMALVRSLRDATESRSILVEGGVFAPREAIALERAGADLVLLGAGLVYTGPGLPKRANEALEYRMLDGEGRTSPARTPVAQAENRAMDLPPEQRAWFWGALLGVAMFSGALLAAWIALTSVLLPYDEAFLGRTRAELEAFSPRIIHFMIHDRITLAGTMVSAGVLYFALAVWGMRLGHHWAQRVVGVSATLGFFPFFAFLGYGFFDPFHAFVTLALLQLTIQVIVRPLGVRRRLGAPPPLDNDRAWRLSQWGQLCFVVQACGLLAGGLTILYFGMSSVFVPEDIAFLGLEPEELRAFDADLVPLIAHDRATFGGMLFAAGLALLFTTLWSFRRGDRWLWWTYLLTILPPYAMTLWIHRHIGYTDLFHLSPVYIGLALLLAGLALSAPHLLGGRRPRGA